MILLKRFLETQIWGCRSWLNWLRLKLSGRLFQTQLSSTPLSSSEGLLLWSYGIRKEPPASAYRVSYHLECWSNRFLPTVNKFISEHTSSHSVTFIFTVIMNSNLPLSNSICGRNIPLVCVWKLIFYFHNLMFLWPCIMNWSYKIPTWCT